MVLQRRKQFVRLHTLLQLLVELLTQLQVVRSLCYQTCAVSGRTQPSVVTVPEKSRQTQSDCREAAGSFPIRPVRSPGARLRASLWAEHGHSLCSSTLKNQYFTGGEGVPDVCSLCRKGRERDPSRTWGGSNDHLREYRPEQWDGNVSQTQFAGRQNCRFPLLQQPFSNEEKRMELHVCSHHQKTKHSQSRLSFRKFISQVLCFFQKVTLKFFFCQNPQMDAEGNNQPWL